MSTRSGDSIDNEAPELLPAIALARRRRSRRLGGREPSLTRRRIINAAIELADAEGADGLSMRRIAQELAVGTATLYGYVETRDELLTHMLDAALAELDVPSQPSGDWRADLSRVARELLGLCRRHPWLPPLLGPRMYLLGHNAARVTNLGIGALEGAGVELRTIQGVLGLVNNFVVGTALRERADTRFGEDARDDEAREQAVATRAYLHTVIASGRYPAFAKMAQITLDGRDMTSDERFEFGLECLLTGIAKQLQLA